MIIKSANFVGSHADVSTCPTDGRLEYAFIGRSNVGKSSLINMLLNKKGLALTSSTPGKTLLINYFLVNDSWYIVDLPGYGYAKVSKKERDQLKTIIDGYIFGCDELTNLFVLLDSRHEPQKIDIDFITSLGENSIPFALVFTKTDKLSKTQLNKNIEVYKEKLWELWEELPPIFLTSSEKNIGREELLNYIEEINLSALQ